MLSPKPGLILSLILPVLACTSDPQLPLVSPDTTDRDAGAKQDTKPKDTKPPATPDTSEVDTAPAPGVDAKEPSDVSPSDVLADGSPADGSADTGVTTDATAGGDGGPGPTAEAKWSPTACDKKALMFPKIDKNNGVFPIGSCPPPEDLNRNCGGNSKIKMDGTKAMAQTWETGYVHPPGYAVDEYLMTRWSSNTMATSFLMLDLGTEQSFKRIYLAWEIAHATDYDIVTSNDGTTWTMLKQVRGGDGFQDILDVDGKARFVRMNGITRGNIGEGPYGYSLFDVTICGERP